MNIKMINILNGHINELFGVNRELSYKRLKVCRKCPLYSIKWSGMCNSKLWLNPETGDVSDTVRDGYYKGCGCRLDAKTTLINEKCPAGKW